MKINLDEMKEKPMRVILNETGHNSKKFTLQQPKKKIDDIEQKKKENHVKTDKAEPAFVKNNDEYSKEVAVTIKQQEGEKGKIEPEKAEQKKGEKEKKEQEKILKEKATRKGSKEKRRRGKRRTERARKREKRTRG